MPRTEPSQKQNCTTPEWRLLKCHQPELLCDAGSPQAVGKAPEPIQLWEYLRSPKRLLPSVSPDISVLLQPSALVMYPSERLDRLVKTPASWSLPEMPVPSL